MNQHLSLETLVNSITPQETPIINSNPSPKHTNQTIPPISKIQQAKISAHQSQQQDIKSSSSNHQQDTNMQINGKTNKMQQDCYLQDQQEDLQSELQSDYDNQSGLLQQKKLNKKSPIDSIKLESSQQGPMGSQSVSEKKKRKIRTTITVQKLKQMNRVFEQYKKNPNGQIKLKQISEQLGLGYSTVLHKYKQFKKTNKVKGGALIQSKFQKRKYKKSLQIQHFITKALQSGNFFTANQLATYIKEHYGKDYSRSIISRHLGEMGYSYKNIKNDGQDQEHEEMVEAVVDGEVFRMKRAELFSRAVGRLVKEGEKVLYLQETHFQFFNENQLQHNVTTTNSKKKKDSFVVRRLPQPSLQANENHITLVFVANQQQISFYRWEKGTFGHNQFYQCLKQIIQTLQMSNPSSQVAKEQIKELQPQFCDVLDFDDFDKDIFFEHQLTPRKQPSLQPIILQKPLEIQKNTDPHSSQSRFLILSFQQCHKDPKSTLQDNSDTLFDLFSSYRIQPIYIPPGHEEKLNMLQLWYKTYMQPLLDKKYKTKKQFTDDCQQTLVKHAYDMEDCFGKVKKAMEQIVEGYEVREQYLEKIGNMQIVEFHDAAKEQEEDEQRDEEEGQQNQDKQWKGEGFSKRRPIANKIQKNKQEQP